MKTSPDSNDASDISQLFRDNDDLGSDSSLLLRAARMLMHDGKPLGQLTLLAFPTADHGSLPFGALTHTENQVVFWPVVPRNTEMVARAGEVTIFDHITLDLRNQKLHATAYDVAGKSLHYDASDFGQLQSWRLQRFEGTGLAIWFSILVRWSVLQDQDFAVQRRVCMPTADSDRRIAEFIRFANQAITKDVPVSRGTSAGDYVYCVAYFVTDPSQHIQLSSDVFPAAMISCQVDGYSAAPEPEVRALKLTYADTQFVFAAACPPGRLSQDLIVGYPRKRLERASAE
jgi:hypothetical protein